MELFSDPNQASGAGLNQTRGKAQPRYFLRPPAHELPSASQPRPALPDPAVCRATPCVPPFAQCLVDHPVCRYAVSYGVSYLCRHPQKEKIIAKTIASEETHSQSRYSR